MCSTSFVVMMVTAIVSAIFVYILKVIPPIYKLNRTGFHTVRLFIFQLFHSFRVEITVEITSNNLIITNRINTKYIIQSNKIDTKSQINISLLLLKLQSINFIR